MYSTQWDCKSLVNVRNWSTGSKECVFTYLPNATLNHAFSFVSIMKNLKPFQGNLTNCNVLWFLIIYNAIKLWWQWIYFNNMHFLPNQHKDFGCFEKYEHSSRVTTKYSIYISPYITLHKDGEILMFQNMNHPLWYNQARKQR
jgi:hypothetical protein